MSEIFNPNIPKAQSGVEKEQLSSLLLVYRDNSLFQKISPMIIQQLTALGRKVDVQTFPVGTEQKEILNWAKENSNKIASNEVLTDGTCNNVAYATMNGGTEPTKAIPHYLDKISEEIMCQTLFGDKEINSLNDMYENHKIIIDLDKDTAEEQTELDLKNQDKLYLAVLNKILQNENNIPAKICIAKEAIIEHDDVCGAFNISIKKQLGELGLKNGENEIFEIQDVLYQKNPLPLNKEIFEKAKEAAAERMADRFEKVGIERKNISIVDKDYSSLDEDNNWIIKDRHFGENRGAYQPKKAKLLELPLGNFIKDASRQGLLNFSDEELGKTLKKALERDFGSKQKE